ncbi:MAG: hypothetical protein ACKN9U_26500, partial [Pirellulaceae bacterium]
MRSITQDSPVTLASGTAGLDGFAISSWRLQPARTTISSKSATLQPAWSGELMGCFRRRIGSKYGEFIDLFGWDGGERDPGNIFPI